MKVFLSVLCLLNAVVGYTFANKTKLYLDLFTNYKKEFGPGENQIIPTELNFFFYIRSLKDLPESNRIIGVVGSLCVKWKDDRLVWNPSDYGGDLNHTSVFVEKIWSPYIAVMSPYEKISPILSGGFSCKLWYNGYVSCFPPPNIFEALCTANVRLYPFDTKNCTLQLYVSENVSQDIKLKTESSIFKREMYIDNGQWNITSTRIFVHSQYLHEDNTSFEILELETEMKRRPGTYMWQLSTIFVLSAMQILVFFLPNESGERVSFSITILLAEIVFLTFTHENLPNAPKSAIPIIFYKQFVDIMTSFIILIGVIHASAKYNETKTEKIKENEDTPVESIEQTKCKDPTAQQIDKIYMVAALVPMFLNNITCYVYVSVTVE